MFCGLFDLLIFYVYFDFSIHYFNKKRGWVMEILKAKNVDLPEILALQYLAYQSEAELFKSRDIPPLNRHLKNCRKNSTMV